MRDLKKEAAWSKDKYKRFYPKLPKKYGEEFSSKLEENGLTFQEWFKNKVDDYMNT